MASVPVNHSPSAVVGSTAILVPSPRSMIGKISYTCAVLRFHENQKKDADAAEKSKEQHILLFIPPDMILKDDDGIALKVQLINEKAFRNLKSDQVAQSIGYYIPNDQDLDQASGHLYLPPERFQIIASIEANRQAKLDAEAAAAKQQAAAKQEKAAQGEAQQKAPKLMDLEALGKEKALIESESQDASAVEEALFNQAVEGRPQKAYKFNQPSNTTYKVMIGSHSIALSTLPNQTTALRNQAPSDYLSQSCIIRLMPEEDQKVIHDICDRIVKRTQKRLSEIQANPKAIKDSAKSTGCSCVIL